MSEVKTSLVRLGVIAFILALAGGMALSAGSAGAGYGVAGINLPVSVWGAALVFAIQWLAFVPAFIWQTERYYDLIGSLSFISLMLFLLTFAPEDPRATVLAVMVVVWAVRLGSFLFVRILQDGTDSRFDEIKPQPLRFLLTWSMQGLWVVLTTAPVIAVLSTSQTLPIGTLGYLGAVMWLVGLVIETLADWQKRQFKRQQSAQPFIASGLWALSRHPNYFGEILLWAGIALMALPVLNGWQYATLISPLFVYLLLTKISGVPLLEAKADKKWGDLPAYQQYKQKTPVLVPFARNR